LFRTEALEFQQHRLHGSILLKRHWPMTIAVLVPCVLVVALMVFFFTAGFARREVVSGVLASPAGTLTLTAPRSAAIARIAAQEGAMVRKGEVLFVLSQERQTLRGDMGQRIEEQLDVRSRSLREDLLREGDQRELRRQTLQKQRDSLAQELQDLDTALALQRQRVALANDVRKRYAELLRTQDVAPVAAQERAAEALEQNARLVSLQREKRQLQAQLAERQAMLDELPLLGQAQGQAAQREISRLTQEQAELAASAQGVVLAPFAGRLSSLVVKAGQRVNEGQSLAMLVPEGVPLEAVLTLPARATGHIDVGHRVWLRYSAFPYEKYGQFGGTVRAIPAAPLPGPETEEARYRVVVTLDRQDVVVGDRRLPLLPGMPLQASLTMERRALWQWIFEPVGVLQEVAQ
jgi:membrane fusion protein